MGENLQLNFDSVLGENTKKMEAVKMEKMTTLNGVTYHGVLDVNDLNEAQNVLNEGDKTRIFDVYDCYNEREANDFCGTYSLDVKNDKDYKRFVTMLENAKVCDTARGIKEKYNDFESGCQSKYINSHTDFDVYYKWIQSIGKLKQDELDSHKCNRCNFREPSFEEFVNNRYEKNGNNGKLTKALSKAGFEQSLIDFYTACDKSEKKVYVTISGNAQYIAGMTYYRKECRWNSCQNPANDEYYSRSLAGSLHDDTLFVAMVHDELEDLDNMYNKLVARTVCRIFEDNGVPFMVGTSYYGDSEGRGLLRKALDELYPFNIFGSDVLGHGDELTMKANGGYHYEGSEDAELYISETFTVTYDCPLCEGSGDYYLDQTDNYITCPHCHGERELEHEVEVEIDETVEGEYIDEEFITYYEGYGHHHNYITATVNLNIIRDKRKEAEAMNKERETVVAENKEEYKAE
jgi:DNA-directed RNA polymerase subunit RPC12/RpoP